MCTTNGGPPQAQAWHFLLLRYDATCDPVARRCGSGKDMVPPATSSIEGVFVFVLSPDEQQVLLVWEYGHWKVRNHTRQIKKISEIQ